MSIDNKVHRMMVGGPLDNKIVLVDKYMPPYKVMMVEEALYPVNPNTAEHTVTSIPGYYFCEEYYEGPHFAGLPDVDMVGSLTVTSFYRWEHMGCIAATKIYMRRSGKSLHEIYHGIQWENWGK